MTLNQEIIVGTKVLKDGFVGTVIEVCEWGTDLVVVRLASGTVCMDKKTFDGQYKNNLILKS